MKKLVALLGALVGSTLVMAQYTPAPTPTPAPATPAPAVVTPPPKPAGPAKPVEKEEPKIPGIVLQRPNGKQLGLTISGGTYKLSFYDKKRKPVQVDVLRARATWNPVYKAIPEATMLNVLDGGKALGGGKPVRPPYAFKLRLTLLKGEGEDEQVAEPTYVIDIQEAALAQK